MRSDAGAIYFVTAMMRSYDVFVNFRGTDTRNGFTGHLYSALMQSEVKVFNEEDGIRVGTENDNICLEAIENSRIAIVVFSPDYASSRRCLDEVAKIIECSKSKSLIVFPVFYLVDPSEVRHQRGRYEKAFDNLKRRYTEVEVNRWRDAIMEATQLRGFLSGERHEFLLIQEIVRDVLSKLDPANSVDMMGSKSNPYSEPIRCDVYLSFRGADTRRGFAGHLYGALVQSEVSVFIDDMTLPIGGNIFRTNTKAIENSKIAIVVLSPNYASSSWCLHELAKIMECHKSKSLTVFPVFYHTEPIDVRKKRGWFGEAFSQHERHGIHMEVVRKWRDALSEAGDIKGFQLGIGNEAELIVQIVRQVLSMLEPSRDDMPFHVPTNLVGMSSHLKAVYECLDMDSDEVCMVALCGMGGIGKTTIAKTIFNEIGRYFRCKGFSANVRETCRDSLTRGLLKLQEGLLSQMGEKVEVWDVDQGSNKIKQTCRSTRTLLLIDDINQRQQLEKLAGACDWFSPRSRIIITTRDKSLLDNRKEIRLYEVPLLGNSDAYKLFKQTLFLENEETDAYKKLIHELLDYTGRLPLAIKVVAAKLSGKSDSEWANTLKALKKIPDREIMGILELSFNDLNDFEKDTLLDVACFFKGQPFNYVRNILDCCELNPDSAMGVLMSRYLISIKYDKVDMHDMIQEMGREIVRKESPKDPGKRSRLWSQDSILDVLTEDTGTEKIEGMKLEFDAPTVVKFNANALTRMRRLRVFMAHNALPSRNSINLPKQLKWLEWPWYPFPLPPLHQHDNGKLVGLYLSYSCIRLLEDDLKSFSNLKFINFSYCASLRKIPDVSSLPHLESLDVEECKELVEVHQSLGLLEKLVHLNFLNCTTLHTFPITLNSQEVHNLLLRGCLKLSKFPEVLVEMEKLKELSLDETAIDELPSSIENLIGLKEFYLENCRKLKTLPSSICRLQKLQRLSFAGCSELGEFPEYEDGSSGSLPALIYLDLQRCGLQEIDFLKDLGCKTTLKDLDLSGSKLCTVHKCIEEFIALQQFNLENCKQLHDIQGLPPNVKYLIAKGCELLEWHFPLSGMLKSQLKESPRVRQIDFSGCCKLSQNVSTSANFFSIEDLLLSSQIKIIYPGSEIPKWFDHQKAEGCLTFSVNPKRHKNIAGWAFCVVIGSGGRKLASLSSEIQVYNNNQMIYHIADIFHSLEKDHIWLVHVPCAMLWGWDTNMKKKCGEFKVQFDLSRGNLKCCGVHLVLKDDGSREGPNSWMHQRFSERYLQA